MREEEKVKEYYKMARMQLNTNIKKYLKVNENGDLYLEFSDGSVYMPGKEIEQNSLAEKALCSYFKEYN